MFGMFGLADGADKQQDIIFSFTTTGKYNQVVTENFFRQIKYKEGN